MSNYQNPEITQFLQLSLLKTDSLYENTIRSEFMQPPSPKHTFLKIQKLSKYDLCTVKN